MSRLFSGLVTIPICWKRPNESITRPPREFWWRLSKPPDFHFLLCLAAGGFIGALLFNRRRAQQRHAEAFSDAGGMLRLNIDEITPQTDPAKLVGPGNQNISSEGPSLETEKARWNAHVHSRFLSLSTKMRAADLPGRLPQASSGRRSAAPQLLPFDCLPALTPFPRKSHRLPFQTVRGCLPQSFHSPQSPSMTRFTLIYPFVLFSLFGNERATRLQMISVVIF